MGDLLDPGPPCPPVQAGAADDARTLRGTARSHGGRRGPGVRGCQAQPGEGASVTSAARSAPDGRRAKSEPQGRGAAWTEERGTSDEGRRRLEAPRRGAGDA